jgi:large subunit ribosomal protein L18
MTELKSRQRKKTKVRQRIKSQGRGRKLTVYRSNKHLWAQIVDLPSGKTLVSGNTKTLGKKGTKTEQALELGKNLAEKALKKDIKRVAFDRGAYAYHGRVKALAEGARQGGLQL